MIYATTQNAIDGTLDIFLVEDNPGDARLIREAFAETARDVSIRHATGGDEAIDRLRSRADSARPDLVLLDLNLPGRDGIDILDSIRDDLDLRRLPVIILTSSADDEDIARSYDASANAYLTKPTDPCDYVSLAESIERFWVRHAEFPPLP